MALRLCPLDLAEANAYCRALHRHHGEVVGHKFSLGVVRDDAICGVVIVGRPVSRMRDDGMTLEVTRLCTDGTKNACSFLYGAAARACFALGFVRIGTYTLQEEGGASLRGAGWKLFGERGGGSWDRNGRPRIDKAPTQVKLLWEQTP
ncbi:MAG: XF1762 family protein [Hyphomonadaceae bacterium]